MSGMAAQFDAIERVCGFGFPEDWKDYDSLNEILGQKEYEGDVVKACRDFLKSRN
jgi:hypothetical protein